MDIDLYLHTDKSECLAIYNSNDDQSWHRFLLNDFEAFLDNELDDLQKIKIRSHGELVGFLGSTIFDEFIFIEWLIVSKPFQNFGFGKSLTRHVVNSARGKIVRVCTPPNNLEFYKRCGFAVVDIIKGAYPDGKDKVRMQYTANT